MTEKGSAHARFSPRQRAVLDIPLTGGSVKQVARELGMSENTACGHVRAIHTKTGTHSIGGLFAWAREHEQCCPGGP